MLRAARAADPMDLYLRSGLFAGFLASAGLPLYIHLPRFAAGAGISLSTLAIVLIGIRVMDLVQDPLLGRLAQAWDARRGALIGVSMAGLAGGFLWLFSVQPGLWGMIGALIVLFTSYSLATILFYARGVALAGVTGQMRLAGWREAGSLAGVILAALLPTLLAGPGGAGSGYAAFGLVLVVFAGLTWIVSRPIWQGPGGSFPTSFPLSALRNSGGGGLLLLALVNALPVALTSTLFLYFVEDRLRLGDLAGGFLILFFAAAGVSAPFWARAAARIGARPMLLSAMALSIVSFAGAASLWPGQSVLFAAICLFSGVAAGADMVILPALFAGLLARSQTAPAAAFGLWSFMAKLALTAAAVIALPLLELSGYRPGETNAPDALRALTFAYAVLPCILKLLAIVLLARLPEETVTQ